LGRVAVIAQLAAGISVAVLFSLLERSWKKALDYISTTFLIHFFMVSMICYFPKSFCWWTCFVASWVASVLLAERISLGFEMEEITLALPAHPDLA
jgi:hypothetical protein